MYKRQWRVTYYKHRESNFEHNKLRTYKENMWNKKTLISR